MLGARWKRWLPLPLRCRSEVFWHTQNYTTMHDAYGGHDDKLPLRQDGASWTFLCLLDADQKYFWHTQNYTTMHDAYGGHDDKLPLRQDGASWTFLCFLDADQKYSGMLRTIQLCMMLMEDMTSSSECPGAHGRRTMKSYVASWTFLWLPPRCRSEVFLTCTTMHDTMEAMTTSLSSSGCPCMWCLWVVHDDRLWCLLNLPQTSKGVEATGYEA